VVSPIVEVEQTEESLREEERLRQEYEEHQNEMAAENQGRLRRQLQNRPRPVLRP
jgi:hypothetical protein